MTKEEAIDRLRKISEKTPIRTNGDDLVAITMAIQALSQEPCDDIAQERYKDLCEYFGGAKDILKSREDFKAWLGRVKWHIRKAEELYEKYEYKKEPCDDAISREELLKAIDTWDKFGYTETGCFVREPKGDYVPYIHYDDVIKCIKGMPPVTQKSGKWIKVKSGDKDFPESIVCSRCNNENSHLDFNENAEPIGKVFVTSKYCPNCGAKMVKPQESEVNNG